LRGAPITLYGDGTQTRAFCYVKDIDGFVKLMAAPDTTTGPINLGNPVETSIAELADLVIELTGSARRSCGVR
jgi:UDP-glucuronate decarboxylase